MTLPPNAKNITRRRFGRLVALKPEGRSGGQIVWLCLCDCGNHTHAASSNLRRGATRSCGCLEKESRYGRNLRHGHLSGGGRQRGPAEYNIWTRIKQRCLNPKDKSFVRYGGRGITLHPAWVDDFEAFFTHIGPRPSKDHSIERIKNDQGYAPGNVRWATRVEQGNNKRNNRLITVGSEAKSVAEWGRVMEPVNGVTAAHIFGRLAKGWDSVEAVVTPLLKRWGRASSKTAQSLKRHAAMKQATPVWLSSAERAEIKALYALARKTGKTVDHIYPLQGRLCSGLHVANNLQLLENRENVSKGARMP